MSEPEPSGDDVDEWRLWLAQNANCGIDFLAATIATAARRPVTASSSLKWTEERPSPTSTSWPRITKRATAKISPWVDLVAREVEFSPGAEPQIYHSVATSDYVIVLAVTPDGRIPLVRQYRPAVEDITLELPAGIVDKGENPAVTASRELLEETGLPSQSIHLLGVNKTDAGRLSNRVYSYFIRTGPEGAEFKPEDGIMARFVTKSELVEVIRTGELDAQADLGTILLAVLSGHLTLSN
jgi:ADP-ribose pyrophosphatase